MKSVATRLTLALLLGCAFASIGPSAASQKKAAKVDAIVVFHDEAPLDSFDQDYQEDDREKGDKDSWGYVKRGVKGAMQNLEKKHGFKSTKAFSHSIKGFAASLSDSQIAELEGDPLVAF